MDDPKDWLSQLLELIPIRGRLEHRCFFGAPWQLDYDPSQAGHLPYHIVLAGSAVLDGPQGGSSRRLAAGSIVVFPKGSGHRLHDGSGDKPAPARQRVGTTITVDENDGPGERSDMLCGRFIVSSDHARLIRAYLPEVLIVSAVEDGAPAVRAGTEAQLAGLVGLMRIETAAESLGGRAMLTGLSTALFSLILRLASERGEVPNGLLALAGHPRLAPALTSLFDRPSHHWTLPELAARCGMSRATFVRQFQKHLGRSAADLLTDIRMTVASNELRSRAASTVAVAEAAGYQSEAAFQRVFKQHMGMTPAQYRRQANAVDQAPERA